MIERTCVARHDWLHGVAPCPQCGLPLDPDRDQVDDLRVVPHTSRPTGARVKHGRCGAEFELEFTQ